MLGRKKRNDEPKQQETDNAASPDIDKISDALTIDMQAWSRVEEIVTILQREPSPTPDDYRLLQELDTLAHSNKTFVQNVSDTVTVKKCGETTGAIPSLPLSGDSNTASEKAADENSNDTDVSSTVASFEAEDTAPIPQCNPLDLSGKIAPVPPKEKEHTLPFESLPKWAQENAQSDEVAAFFNGPSDHSEEPIPVVIPRGHGKFSKLKGVSDIADAVSTADTPNATEATDSLDAAGTASAVNVVSAVDMPNAVDAPSVSSVIDTSTVDAPRAASADDTSSAAGKRATADSLDISDAADTSNAARIADTLDAGNTATHANEHVVISEVGPDEGSMTEHEAVSYFSSCEQADDEEDVEDVVESDDVQTDVENAIDKNVANDGKSSVGNAVENDNQDSDPSTSSSVPADEPMDPLLVECINNLKQREREEKQSLIDKENKPAPSLNEPVDQIIAESAPNSETKGLETEQATGPKDTQAQIDCHLWQESEHQVELESELKPESQPQSEIKQESESQTDQAFESHTVDQKLQYKEADDTRDDRIADASAEVARTLKQSPSHFQCVYTSRDGRLVVFEDAEGHLSAVDVNKLA